MVDLSAGVCGPVCVRASVCDGQCVWGGTHGRAGRSQVLQHVGDGDLQQGLPEELLAHRAAVIVVFLWSDGRKENQLSWFSCLQRFTLTPYENQCGTTAVGPFL